MIDAIRALTNRPATALAGVLTLAVAVGINLAMFGLIDRAILSPHGKTRCRGWPDGARVGWG